MSPQRLPVVAAQTRAQPGCFQDVRALQYHQGKVDGFYLEVGVADATHHNNTWLLDDAYGWRGVCVDPVVANIERRACVWFAVALASREGSADFSLGGPWSGLSEFTTSPTHNAKWHAAAAGWPTKTVPTRTPLQVGGGRAWVPLIASDCLRLPLSVS